MSTAVNCYLKFINFDVASVDALEELINCDIENFKNLLVGYYFPGEFYADVKNQTRDELTQLVDPSMDEDFRENFIYLSQTKIKFLDRTRTYVESILHSDCQ
jgi:hypothetical protein